MTQLKNTFGTKLLEESTLLHDLFVKDSTRVLQSLEDLILENHQLGNPAEGFLFHGTFWTFAPVAMHSKIEKKLLHEDLHEKGLFFVKEHYQIKQDQVMLTQGLHMLLRDCKSPQDVRDALPDVVMRLLPQTIASLKRTRPEAWTIRNNPFQAFDYQKVLDLLCFYVANRMLY